MATDGKRDACTTPFLKPSVAPMTATWETSLPVPAVVGTAIMGTREPLSFARPAWRSSQLTPAWGSRTLTALATSMAEPPPTATSALAPIACAVASAAATVATPGLPGTSLNTSTDLPPAASAGMRRSRMPVARRPASVMTIDRARAERRELALQIGGRVVGEDEFGGTVDSVRHDASLAFQKRDDMLRSP